MDFPAHSGLLAKQRGFHVKGGYKGRLSGQAPNPPQPVSRTGPPNFFSRGQGWVYRRPCHPPPTVPGRIAFDRLAPLLLRSDILPLIYSSSRIMRSFLRSTPEERGGQPGAISLRRTLAGRPKPFRSPCPPSLATARGGVEGRVSRAVSSSRPVLPASAVLDSPAPSGLLAKPRGFHVRGGTGVDSPDKPPSRHSQSPGQDPQNFFHGDKGGSLAGRAFRRRTSPGESLSIALPSYFHDRTDIAYILIYSSSRITRSFLRRSRKGGKGGLPGEVPAAAARPRGNRFGSPRPPTSIIGHSQHPYI